MIDNGVIWSSESKEVSYTNDYVYVHKDIKQITTDEGGTVYECHEYKYPVMEYIELLKNQTNDTEQRSAILTLQVNNLQSEVQ